MDTGSQPLVPATAETTHRHLHHLDQRRDRGSPAASASSSSPSLSPAPDLFDLGQTFVLVGSVITGLITLWLFAWTFARSPPCREAACRGA